jgi:nucleotide-binding universal stress UspA family protein
MFEKILVCLDGSRLAEQILPYVSEQAKRFNSKIVFLQAYMVPNREFAAVTPGGPVASPQLLQQEDERLKNEAASYLETVAEPLRENGLDVACVVLNGVAGDVILGYTQNEPVDLIALSTHGRSGLGRIVFGSVADQVLRESGLPILVIKPQEIED